MTEAKNWQNINFTSVFESVSKEDMNNGRFDFFVNGTAINEGVSRNGVLYTFEELEKAAKSLEGKPILKDHNNEVDSVVGRVKEARFDPSTKSIKYRGQIMDKKAREMISDGRITNVSIGAIYADSVEETVDEKTVNKVSGLEILELSLTPVPGDPMASITQALEESIKLRNKEGKQMVKETKPAEAPVVAEAVPEVKAEPVETSVPTEAAIEELQAEIASLKEQARQKEVLALKEEIESLKANQAKNETKGVVAPAKEESVAWEGYHVGRNENGVIELYKKRSEWTTSPQGFKIR